MNPEEITEATEKVIKGELNEQCAKSMLHIKDCKGCQQEISEKVVISAKQANNATGSLQ